MNSLYLNSWLTIVYSVNLTNFRFTKLLFLMTENFHLITISMVKTIMIFR